ncbi:hypothetical protein, partial [Acidaminococcus timonensis]|uniref:hypothetical protein n=1 Tax=Acidaminococcus timonensis TaxID=1871002 RepID=UPI0025E5EDD6
MRLIAADQTTRYTGSFDCVVGPWRSGEGHEQNKSDFIFVNRPGTSFAKKKLTAPSFQARRLILI